MVLSKQKSLDLIHRRLSALQTSIADLDTAVAKKDSLEAELVKLRAVEADLIAKDSCSPGELVQHRAKIDLTVGKLQRAARAVAVAEESVVLDGETATQVISGFKQAAVFAHFDDVKAKIGAFFDAQDIPFLQSMAGKSVRARSLVGHEEFLFSPQTLAHRAHNVAEARRLAGSFAQLEQSSSRPRLRGFDTASVGRLRLYFCRFRNS